MMVSNCRPSHLLEPWEEQELEVFLRNRRLGYWKLYDATNGRFFYVNEYGRLKNSVDPWACNEDDLYWTRSGDGLIENNSGMVLTYDGSSLKVVDIDARGCAEWNGKWTFLNGQLFNDAYDFPLGRDEYTGAYWPGGGYQASQFRTVEPDMLTEALSIRSERVLLHCQDINRRLDLILGT